jgi:hypothetical protein
VLGVQGHDAALVELCFRAEAGDRYAAGWLLALQDEQGHAVLSGLRALVTDTDDAESATRRKGQLVGDSV